MNNHLSRDQFAKWFIGWSTRAELQHIRECSECGAELDRFGGAISSLRSVIRDRIDARVASHTADIPPFSISPAAAGIPKWRWALAAASVVIFALVTLPFFTSENEPQAVIEKAPAEINPDALMNAVNRHLSRTLPAPMEPMMMVISNEESITQPGGVR